MRTGLSSLIAALGVFALLLGMFAFPLAMSGGTVSAGAITEPDQPGATGAVAVCQEFRDSGILDEAGATFGECVNVTKGPSSENATNFFAAICGIDSSLEFTNTANKGQCIKVVRALFEES